MPEKLQEKITEFLETLGDDEDVEWYTTDKEIGKIVLKAFLWWLHPELRPKDDSPLQGFAEPEEDLQESLDDRSLEAWGRVILNR